MDRKKSKKGLWILMLVGAGFVIWMAVLAAPVMRGGLPDIIRDLPSVMEHPFQIAVTEQTPRTVAGFLLVYGIACGIFYSSQKNYRNGEEHGSASWGDVREIAAKYAGRSQTAFKLLTKHIKIGLDGRKHKRNVNVMVVGGSGSGKTRGYAKPNVMQADSSMVVLDPKGEILRACGRLLEERGYEVRILDLINPETSHCYNPFFYLKTDNDVQRLVTNLFKSTTPKGAQTMDPFWDLMAQALLMAIACYLKDEAPPDEQNFFMVLEMLRAGAFEGEDDAGYSDLDGLFDELREKKPGHIALKYYSDYHSGPAKTLKSIQVSLASRLEKFNLESIAKLTMTDEMDLASLGEKKVALFALIPDNDVSFNFLVSILYTQLFQQLFYLADHKYRGSLPVHVHFVMDEFANVSLPDDFDKILSVMRSRNVSVSIILQNLAQLKALFEKQWESILGNCDEFLYLGGNEQSTHKYVSELLGKETIDTRTFNETTGERGHWTRNFQTSGRELLMADEVRQLDNDLAVLFIRGEKPVIDQKYDLLRHPNISMTEDGGAEPFLHGQADSKSGVITAMYAVKNDGSEAEETEPEDTGYELCTEEDLEKQFHNEKERTSKDVQEET